MKFLHIIISILLPWGAYSQYFTADTLLRDSLYYPNVIEFFETDKSNKGGYYIQEFEINENRENFKGKILNYKQGFSFLFNEKNNSIEKSYYFKDKFDTCFINGIATVFYNPFPHVYNELPNIDTLGSSSSKLKATYSGINYSYSQENGHILEMCISNDSLLGTLKRYWYHSGVKKKEGYFWKNKKNGVWKYWNKKGELYRIERWVKGILKDSKEIP